MAHSTQNRGFESGLAAADRNLVGAFARGLLVIRAFGEGAELLTLSQVAQRANLTRAGARRILLTLQALGYAAQRDRHYYLTPKVLALGYAYLASTPMFHFAQPILERLVQETNETCSLSVLDGTESVYVLRIPVHRILSIGVSVGSRLPAHSTSMGRVLLSGLAPHQLDEYFARAELRAFTAATVTDPEKLHRLIQGAQRAGWAWVNGEMEAHIAGLSVPVLDARNEVVAALNVSFNRTRIWRDDVLPKFLPKLQDAARQIHDSLLLHARGRHGNAA